MEPSYLSFAVTLLYPDADLDPVHGNVSLVDHGDGKGPRIERWDLPVPRPTQAQLDAVELNAIRLERKNAVAEQERRDLLALFGSREELALAALLSPPDQRVQDARQLRAGRQAEEAKIEGMTKAALLAYRTPSEKARGK